METTVPAFLGSTSCFGTLIRQGQAAADIQCRVCAGSAVWEQSRMPAWPMARFQGCTRQSSHHRDPCSRLCRPAMPSMETALSSNPALLSLFEPHFLSQTGHTFLRFFFGGGVMLHSMCNLSSPTRDRTPTLAPCSGSTGS